MEKRCLEGVVGPTIVGGEGVVGSVAGGCLEIRWLGRVDLFGGGFVAG